MPHTYINLLPLFLSGEGRGVCIQIGNTKMLLAAVLQFLQRVWSDTDITELLGFRNKTIPAGDLNAKHPGWNSKVSNPTCLNFLGLFFSSDFKISATRYPVHCTPDERGDVLDIVVHQNVRLSEVIVTEILILRSPTNHV
jgi:hypothetical protein